MCTHLEEILREVRVEHRHRRLDVAHGECMAAARGTFSVVTQADAPDAPQGSAGQRSHAAAHGSVGKPSSSAL